MLVVCNGMPRSASTWSFNVVKQLLRTREPAAAIYSGYDENVGHFLETTTATANHVVLKCHTLDALGRALARVGAAKIVYTHREVSDAVVSCMRIFKLDFEEAITSVQSSVDLYAFHRETGNALILSYEVITQRPVEAVASVGSYLGIDTPRSLVAEVAHETPPASLRRTVEELNVLHDDPHAYDPETLLHPHHFAVGPRGALTADQLRRLEPLVDRRRAVACRRPMDRRLAKLLAQPAWLTGAVVVGHRVHDGEPFRERPLVAWIHDFNLHAASITHAIDVMTTL